MAAPSAVDYTARAGPEDRFVVKSTVDGSSWRTGPRATIVPTDAATAADKAEFGTLSRFISTEPYKSIMLGLAQSRHLCSQQRMATSLCASGKPEHLKASQCATKVFDEQRCMMKLARFTQRECKPELQALAECMRTDGAAAGSSDPRAIAACTHKFVAFDVCTEEF